MIHTTSKIRDQLKVQGFHSPSGFCCLDSDEYLKSFLGQLKQFGSLDITGLSFFDFRIAHHCC